MADFKISVDVSKIAEQLGHAKDLVQNKLTQAIESLSIAAHAFIVNKANSELNDYQRQAFLGLGEHGKKASGVSSQAEGIDPAIKNVRWIKIANGMWVVEIDEKADWIEHGRPRTFMGEDWWLLKPGKAKIAKDGCVLNPRNKVLTSIGWKKIKDIKAGDMVLSHSGKFREVKELLVRKAGIGTKYVNFYIKSEDRSGKVGHTSDLSSPSISLTDDHLVLTPIGWIEAGKLNNGDLVASPADMKRRCKQCDAPLPINAPQVLFCLNNSCARTYSCVTEKRGLGSLTPTQRSINSALGHRKAKEMGIFDRCNRGARNPTVLHKLRIKSAELMRRLTSSGKWAPEVFFEKCLSEIASKLQLLHKNHSGELGVSWVRVSRIKKGIVNRPDHAYANKYDICLDADEHSFCCQTIFIHNSTYRVIPMSQMKGNKPTFSTGPLGEGPGGDIAKLIKKAAKSQGLSLTKIETNANGQPKLGVLHRLNVKEPRGGAGTHGLFYSKPRTAEEAAAVGLKPHGGHYRLAGAAVIQREGKGGAVSRETVTFRVISSKHKAEGRWMYPEVHPLNSIPAAHKWANAELDKIIQTIDEELRR